MALLALVVVQELEEEVDLPLGEGAALPQGGLGEQLGRGLIESRGRQRGHLGSRLDIYISGHVKVHV